MASFPPTLIITACAVLVLLLAASVDFTSAEEQAHHRENRAIGGQRFRRGEWPWLVLMRATIVTRRLFGIPIDHYHLYCGGVLISSQWVLTAAHCFTGQGSAGMNARNWEARMASTRIRSSISQRVVDVLGRLINNNDFRQWEIDAERIILHPGYSQSDREIADDIALVKLRRPAPNVDAVRPIQLPNYGGASFPLPGARCIATGWGCTSPGGRVSTWAQQIDMPVLPSSRCQRFYNMDSMQGRICAGHVYRGIGVCLGDSGGPLVCQPSNVNNSSSSSNSNNYMLAGIVSFTSLNRPESFPAVFTKVQSYTPWMERVMSRY